jgi:hypothetical protein
MNTTDLIIKYAHNNAIGIQQATEDINRVFSLIKEALRNGETVDITGFGEFRVLDFPDKLHTYDGGKMLDPAYKTVIFIEKNIVYNHTTWMEEKEYLNKNLDLNHPIEALLPTILSTRAGKQALPQQPIVPPDPAPVITPANFNTNTPTVKPIPPVQKKYTPPVPVAPPVKPVNVLTSKPLVNKDLVKKIENDKVKNVVQETEEKRVVPSYSTGASIFGKLKRNKNAKK